MDWESFNPKLERERARLSQAAMAAHFGVDPSQISRWEGDPDGMTRSQLRRWADACGYFASPDGLELADPYQGLRRSIEQVASRVEEWHDYLEAEDGLPSPESVARAIANIPLKPIGALAGMPDSGKSRLLNTLYGADVLPVGFGPATKLLCICRHIDERPAGMDAAVYILGEQFDPSKVNDVDQIRLHQQRAGGLELLKEFGVHDYQKQRERLETLKSLEVPKEEKGNDGLGKSRYALIYLDSPFLLATDILDAPGFSEDPDDVERAFEAIRRAHYLIHCSSANGYMNNTDLQILQEAFLRLPAIPTVSGNPFGNIVFACTHATQHISDTDLDKIRFIGATRLQQHLGRIAPKELKSRCLNSSASTPAGQRDAIYTRMVPFFVESGERRAKAMEAIDAMLTDDVPPFARRLALKRVGAIVGSLRGSYERALERFNDMIGDIDAGLKEYQNLRKTNRSRQSALNQKKNELDEIIYEQRERSELEIGVIADFFSDYRNVERAIRDYYGDDREEARAGASALISGFIQRQVISVLRKKVGAVDTAVQEIATFHSQRILTSGDIDEVGEISGLDTNTFLRVAGGLGAGGVGVLALAGIIPVLAPVVALGLVIGGLFSAAAGALRSWQEKMARRLADSLKARNIKKVLVKEAGCFWDQIEARANASVTRMERAHEAHVLRLERLVAGDPGEIISELKTKSAVAQRTLEYVVVIEARLTETRSVESETARETVILGES